MHLNFPLQMRKRKKGQKKRPKVIINAIVIWKAVPSFPAYKSDLECGLKVKNNFKKTLIKKQIKYLCCLQSYYATFQESFILIYVQSWFKWHEKTYGIKWSLAIFWEWITNLSKKKHDCVYGVQAITCWKLIFLFFFFLHIPIKK